MKRLNCNYTESMSHGFDIYNFKTISLRMPRIFCAILLQWDTDIAKLLFILCHGKVLYKQSFIQTVLYKEVLPQGPNPFPFV